MGVSAVAVVAAVVHLAWPHVEFDAVTLTLLAVALIPWLGGLFESITLPGGAGVQFRQLAARVEDTEATAARLEREVEGAADTSQVALTAAQGRASGDGTSGLDAVHRLAADYLNLRAALPSGSERTRLMQQIFDELVRATVRVPEPPLGSWLASENGGLRLAAYTRLFVDPEPDRLDALLDAVLDDEFAFSVSRGIRAVEKTVDVVGPSAVPEETVRRLRTYWAQLPEGNRKRNLRRLLDRFP